MLFFSLCYSNTTFNLDSSLSSRTKIKQSTAVKRRLIVESFVVLFIILSPFIFKLHEYVSDEEGATLNFLGFVIDDNGFQNLRINIWFLLGKLVPLSLLLIWFFTCKHWWYHIILIPVLMYAFQIFESVYSLDKNVDSENILWLLPICMVLIPFVYFIRIKLYDKYVHGIDLDAIDAELASLKSNPVVEEEIDSSALEQELESLKQESLADEINRKLSTRHLEQLLKQFQLQMQSFLSFTKK